MVEKNYSRLSKHKARSAFRSTAFYVVLTVSLIVFLGIFGISFLSKVTNFIFSLTGQKTQIVLNKETPISAPKLDSMPRYTKDKKISIKGKSKPGETIKVFVGNESKEVISNANGEFTASFELTPGIEQTIYAIAVKGSVESPQSKLYTVTYDSTPPELKVVTPENGASFFGSQNQSQIIHGETERAAKLMINDRLVIVQGDGNFDYRITLNEGDNIFLLKSSDEAGNETELEHKLKFSP